MKIAYTLNGLIGGLTGKNSSGSSRDDQVLVLKYVSNLLQKYIIPQNKKTNEILCRTPVHLILSKSKDGKIHKNRPTK